jgi:hypothetical protein
MLELKSICTTIEVTPCYVANLTKENPPKFSFLISFRHMDTGNMFKIECGNRNSLMIM